MSELKNPLARSLASIVNDVQYYLERLSAADYASKLDVLSGATIGQHTRHFIEFFQCLYHQVNDQHPIVDYGTRKRDIRIEVDPDFAKEVLTSVSANMLGQQDQWNRSITLRHESDDPNAVVTTSYAREICYGVEHCIHHLAIIKIGIKQINPNFDLPANFGIAPSTVKYREKTCAQ